LECVDAKAAQVETRDPPEELQPQRAEQCGGEGLETWRVADLVHIAHLRHDEGEAEKELPLDEEGDRVGGGAEGDDARVAPPFQKRGGEGALPIGTGSLDAIAKGEGGIVHEAGEKEARDGDAHHAPDDGSEEGEGLHAGAARA
jgi:hypothetical protein